MSVNDILQDLPYTIEQMIAEAKAAMDKAYVPYSNFKVGAALIDDDNKLYHGCNIENAAYGPTNCAERTALFSAIAVGKRPGQFKIMAVIGDTAEPITPCGVCRQVIAELCKPDMPVVLSNLQGQYRVTTITELLPGAFTSRELNG